MKYLLAAIALLFVIVLVIHVLGARMPREHRASRSRRIRASAAEIFRAITDVDGLTKWRPELKAVRRLDDVGGKRRYRETSGHGELTFEVTDEIPDSRLVTTIVDEGQPFGGRWTTELRQVDGHTEITITEDGFVNPPIFRFLIRYVFGQTATIETCLKNLETRFGTSIE